MADAKKTARWLRALADGIETVGKESLLAVAAVEESGRVRFMCISGDEDKIGPALAETESIDLAGMAETDTIHVLLHGFPLCQFTTLVPGHWPKDHKWIGYDDWRDHPGDATCPKCSENALKINGEE